MKIYQGDDWIPPFSTRLNCINTIDSECKRGLTLEECMKKCNDSNYCNAGYFVKINRAPPGSYQSFCVPLNTVSYHNVNLLDTLGKSSNPTKLSKDRKDIEYTLFFNEKRFPEQKDYPDDFNSFLFSGNNVYLKNNGKYLNRSLQFQDEKSFIFKIIKFRFKFEDLTCRITTDMSITISDTNGLNWIIMGKDHAFRWSNNSDMSFNFNFFNTKSNDFINEGDIFSLYSKIKNKYVFVNPKNELTLSDTDYSFFMFEKAASSHYKSFNENTLEKFLCTHYPDCKESYEPQKNIMFIIICVFTCFIIFIWIIILYRLMRK